MKKRYAKYDPHPMPGYFIAYSRELIEKQTSAGVGPLI